MHAVLGGRTARASMVLAGTALAIGAGTGTAWAASSATGTPTAITKDGTVVAIKGSGFGADLDLVVLQCSGKTPTSCDTAHIAMAKSDANGAVTTTFKAIVGKVGDGTCVAGSTECFIAITDIAGKYPTAVKLTYPKATTSTPTKTPTNTPTKTTTTTKPVTTTKTTPTAAKPSTSGQTLGGGTVQAPVSVAAGSGGLADEGGSNLALTLAIAVGGTALAGGTLLQSRRGRRVEE